MKWCCTTPNRRSRTPLPQSSGMHREGGLVVAADLSAAYYIAGSGLYRYDISGQKLEFLMSVSQANGSQTMS